MIHTNMASESPEIEGCPGLLGALLAGVMLFMVGLCFGLCLPCFGIVRLRASGCSGTLREPMTDILLVAPFHTRMRGVRQRIPRCD